MKCKCGSEDFFVEKHGNNTGIYCKSCGKWQKWATKDEVRLYMHNEDEKISSINSLINECQHRLRFHSCEECENYYAKGKLEYINTIGCLKALLLAYNKKYDKNYIIVDGNKTIKDMVDNEY